MLRNIYCLNKFRERGSQLTDLATRGLSKHRLSHDQNIVYSAVPTAWLPVADIGSSQEVLSAKSENLTKAEILFSVTS